MTISYSSNSQNLYKEKLEAFAYSVLNLEHAYISLKVDIGKITDAGPIIQREGGTIVLKAENLYYLFKEKYNEYDFGNYLLALKVRNERILLTESQFQKVKNFLIADEDVIKYSKLESLIVIKENAKDKYLPNINEDSPDYKGRCIIFNLINNGYIVGVEDESGFLIYRKI